MSIVRRVEGRGAYIFQCSSVRSVWQCQGCPLSDQNESMDNVFAGRVGMTLHAIRHFLEDPMFPIAKVLWRLFVKRT